MKVQHKLKIFNRFSSNSK